MKEKSHYCTDLMNTKKKKHLKNEQIVSKCMNYQILNGLKKKKIIKTCDLIPDTLGWSMKVIGKTGSGKTTFVSAFIDFLLGYIQNIENIYLLSNIIILDNKF